MPLRDEVVRRSPGIQDHPEAIGLHLEAAPDGLSVAVLCAVYMLATAIFGIVWWLVNDDMQGAFSAAGYFASLVGIPTFMLMLVVSCVE